MTEATLTTAENGNGVAAPEEMNVQALLERIDALEQRVVELEESPAQDIENRLAMVVFSGDLDKAIASFIIATGAAAMGLEVSMFFTFWGLSVIKKETQFKGKNVWEQGFAAMLPGSSHNLSLSQMSYFGVGSRVIRKLMNDHDVSSLEELMEMAREFGVRFIACDMSKELLGVRDEELIDDVELGGVATFIGDAARAKASIFI